MKLTFAIIGAALLTLILSPTLRGHERRQGVLQAIFYRDFPLTPYGFEPKYQHFQNGVRTA